MKYSKIEFITDGTSANTSVKVDGKVLEGVQRIEFAESASDPFCRIEIHIAKMYNGKPKIKPVKVRDNKTEKFYIKDEIETEILILERM